MILSEDLTPVSELSAAFLQPKSAVHLAFAYYQSSLAVEYLLERYGLETMKKVFADLARGVTLNEALTKNAAPLEQIDKEFTERAKQIALGTAPKLKWDKPKAEDVTTESAYDKWLESNPDNYTALLDKARKLVEARKWKESKEPLQRLIELYPDQHNEDSAYMMLSKVHKELGESEEELAMLKKVAELSADATDAYARLIQIGIERNDWPFVIENAARYEAVNPLSPLPHRAAAEAHEALGAGPAAIKDYQTLLALDPNDSTDIHFRLARLFHKERKPEARRHVLLALEEAPRFREALQLLVEINRTGKERP
jgi:tetratricopeptide (TPR) repeat protein